MKSQETPAPMERKRAARSKTPSGPTVSRTGGVKRPQRDAAALLTPARSEPVRLSDEVLHLRNDFVQYVEQASKDLEAARQEVQRLARRVHHLEQLLKQRARTETPVVSTQAPPPAAKSLFTFLGRSNLASLS